MLETSEMFYSDRNEACLDCGIDFGMSCWMYFYMFSNYCFSMTCLKLLKVLNVSLKESCLFP